MGDDIVAKDSERDFKVGDTIVGLIAKDLQGSPLTYVWIRGTVVGPGVNKHMCLVHWEDDSVKSGSTAINTIVNVQIKEMGKCELATWVGHTGTILLYINGYTPQEQGKCKVIAKRMDQVVRINKKLEELEWDGKQLLIHAGKKMCEDTKCCEKKQTDALSYKGFEKQDRKYIRQAIELYTTYFDACSKNKHDRRRLTHEARSCCPPVIPSALTNSTTEATMTPSERVLHRRRLTHGVRTPVVLAALMEDIEDAKRNWTPRRR